MKKYLDKRIVIVVILLLVATLPLLLQKSGIASRQPDQVLVVITPHNEAIRYEIAHAFQVYWKEKTGQQVSIDWRAPGGLAEMVSFLETEFQNVTPQEGIGIDVCFGGDDSSFQRMAEQGYFEKLSVFEDHPEWFEGENGIPQTHAGEVYYSKAKVWVGMCLSRFGICYNLDKLEQLEVTPPLRWDSLGTPEYFGLIAIADPTKNDSIVKAFEMLIQQKIQEQIATLKRKTGENENQRRQRAIRHGWAEGMNLIQRIAANTRYFIDADTKVPSDIAQGNVVAGICIDFHGRAYHEKLKKQDGSSRVQWVAPENGGSYSADPVAVFRNAPHSELAQSFVEFLLSDRGQVLWNKKVGTRFGPVHHALRRLPIRPAVYRSNHQRDFTDIEDVPYLGVNAFEYQKNVTGEASDSLASIIKNICIAPHRDLKAAWKVLIDNDMPERPLAHFHDVSYVSYVKARGGIRNQVLSKSRLETIAAAKRMTNVFRRNYKETINLAKEEGSK